MVPLLSVAPLFIILRIRCCVLVFFLDFKDIFEKYYYHFQDSLTMQSIFQRLSRTIMGQYIIPTSRFIEYAIWCVEFPHFMKVITKISVSREHLRQVVTYFSYFPFLPYLVHLVRPSAFCAVAD